MCLAGTSLPIFGFLNYTALDGACCVINVIVLYVTESIWCHIVGKSGEYDLVVTLTHYRLTVVTYVGQRELR